MFKLRFFSTLQCYFNIRKSTTEIYHSNRRKPCDYLSNEKMLNKIEYIVIIKTSYPRRNRAILTTDKEFLQTTLHIMVKC